MKLYIPEEAVTENSMVLFWDKEEQAERYRIEVDGVPVQAVEETDAEIMGLRAETEYRVKVTAVDSSGNRLAESTEVPVWTRRQGKTHDIRLYGARACAAAGETAGNARRETVLRNTKAIQEAIDRCAPGDVVLIPEGTFISGALFLHSDMTLRLDHGAVLRASSDPEDFPPFVYRYEGLLQRNYACLINTTAAEQGWERNLRNITITGDGTIDANGAALFRKELDSPAANRSNAVCIRNTSGLFLHGVTIREAPFWCLHPVNCDHVTMYGIRINNRRGPEGKDYGLYNGDGIDPDSCSYVAILHSDITSQDDCIAVKAGRCAEGRKIGIPSEHIRVSNCDFHYGFGVAMGSESSAGIRDILVQDCRFTDSFSIASVKNRRGKGGYIEDITYDHCTLVNRNPEVQECKWFRGAVNIDQTYGEDSFDAAEPAEINEDTPYIGHIFMKNIMLDSPFGKPFYVCGLPERHLDGIILENIAARGKDMGMFSNVDHLEMRNVSITCVRHADRQ